jgi:hypothetical protein
MPTSDRTNPKAMNIGHGLDPVFNVFVFDSSLILMHLRVGLDRGLVPVRLPEIGWSSVYRSFALSSSTYFPYTHNKLATGRADCVIKSEQTIVASARLYSLDRTTAFGRVSNQLQTYYSFQELPSSMEMYQLWGRYLSLETPYVISSRGLNPVISLTGIPANPEICSLACILVPYRSLSSLERIASESCFEFDDTHQSSISIHKPTQH